MTSLFGTLTVEELFWLLSNVVGLTLAVAAALEQQMDAESVRILGLRGTIAGADVRARLLKARGGRRDELIKASCHLVMLIAGIILSASPTPRLEYEAFAALWSAYAVIVTALLLSAGSVGSLLDRRRLWAMFEVDDETDATLKKDAIKEEIGESVPVVEQST